MCFITSIKHSEPVLATEDVVCWKLMYSNTRSKDIVHSKFQNFQYQLGYRYREHLGFDISYLRTKNCYHSEHTVRTSSSRYLRIDRGIHSYSSIERARYINSFYSTPADLYECIIPAGSWYYIDPKNHEYCSNEIAIMKRISS